MKNDLIYHRCDRLNFLVIYHNREKKKSKCINQWDFKELHVMSAKLKFSCYKSFISQFARNEKYHSFNWYIQMNLRSWVEVRPLCLHLVPPIWGVLLEFFPFQMASTGKPFFHFFPYSSFLGQYSNIWNPKCLLVLFLPPWVMGQMHLLGQK